MNLLLHKMWSDLRDACWAWVAWLGMLLAQIIACALFFYGRIDAPLPWLLGLLWLGQIVAGVCLVHRLFRIDAYQSPTAFWVSRPVRPGVLLLAKYGTALGALLIPMMLARFACQSIVQLDAYDLGEWRWAVLWVMFGTGLAGIIHWSRPKAGQSLSALLLLTIAMVLVPHSLSALYDTWCSESPGHSRPEVRNYFDTFALKWDYLWFKQRGILLITAFLTLLTMLLMRKRTSLSLLWLLLGIPFLNWLWVVSGSADAVIPRYERDTPFQNSFKALVTGLDAVEGDGTEPQGTSAHPLPDHHLAEPLSIARGEVEWDETEGAKFHIPLPEQTSFPPGLIIVAACYIKDFSLPVGIQLPPETKLALVSDVNKLLPQPQELMVHGFTEDQAKLIVNGANAKSGSSKFQRFLEHPRTESTFGHLKVMVYRYGSGIHRAYGPIGKRASILLAPGIRANCDSSGYSLCQSLSPRTPPRLSSRGVDFPQPDRAYFTSEGSDRHQAFPMPLIFLGQSHSELSHENLINFPRITPYEPKNFWLIHLSSERLAGEFTIDVDFEIPETWRAKNAVEETR